MKQARALMMALPLVLAGGSAMAATNLSGNYTVTLTIAHPGSAKGTTGCFALNENGSVQGWKNSGTASLFGVKGSFFIVQRVLTAWIPLGSDGYILMSGYLTGGTLGNTSVVEVTNGQTVLTGNFSATKGC